MIPATVGTSTSVTKAKILDTAEKLFGDKGFDATSLRDITTEAQVSLATTQTLNSPVYNVYGGGMAYQGTLSINANFS